LADALLRRFPTVRYLVEAKPSELAAVRHMGKARAAVVAAALQLGHRLEFPCSEQITVRGPADVYRSARRYQASLRREALTVLVCSQRGRVRRIDPPKYLSEPVNAETFPYAEIIQLVRRFGGRGLAVGHTRRGGCVYPTRVHHQIAVRLAHAAVEARLVLRGYVLIGYREWTSVPTDFDTLREAVWQKPRRLRPEGRPYSPPPCQRIGGRYCRTLVAAC
jgi:DNA repair protein RadC